jgi:hypothetical protein
MATLALYTTVYPGVERYLADWHASVRGQTDLDFDLWIGLDVLDVEAATEAMGGRPDAVWVRGAYGDTPGSLRQRVLAQIVDRYDAVVLVDSDDLMHATRVASARAALRSYDLVGCALRLVDERGASLDTTFTVPPDMAPEEVFPRTNAFGLSNTAYRTDVLRRCLPIPHEAALVDWYLSTRAWLSGATMARVHPPFSQQQVIQDTARVREHFRLVRASRLDDAIPERLAKLERAAADVELFFKRVVLQPARLGDYVAALNELSTTSLWWAWVADAALRHLWANPKGAT